MARENLFRGSWLPIPVLISLGNGREGGDRGLAAEILNETPPTMHAHSFKLSGRYIPMAELMLPGSQVPLGIQIAKTTPGNRLSAL